MRVIIVTLALLAQAVSAEYSCKTTEAPIVLAKPALTASYVPKPTDGPNAVCQNTKGVCHADKVILCHMQGTYPLTLCLPEVSVPRHMKEHPEDFCGCCGPAEKTIPSYCVGKAKGTV